jgi:hypothetical protein
MIMADKTDAEKAKEYAEQVAEMERLAKQTNTDNQK